MNVGYIGFTVNSKEIKFQGYDYGTGELMSKVHKTFATNGATPMCAGTLGEGTIKFHCSRYDAERLLLDGELFDILPVMEKVYAKYFTGTPIITVNGSWVENRVQVAVAC